MLRLRKPLGFLNFLSSEGTVTGGGGSAATPNIPGSNAFTQTFANVAKAAANANAPAGAGWIRAGQFTPPCAPGYTPQYSQDGQYYQCVSGGAGAELTHGPNAGQPAPSGTQQGACPAGWFVTDPYNANPCPAGQYVQTFSPDGYTQCGRCQQGGAAFQCPNGWTTQQVPCNPGEQPLELIHRNMDGSIVSCFQCRQTQESVSYQASLAQGQQVQPPATPAPVQVTSPGGGGGIVASVEAWPTWEKVAGVAAIGALAYFIFKKKGR